MFFTFSIDHLNLTREFNAQRDMDIDESNCSSESSDFWQGMFGNGIPCIERRISIMMYTFR